MISSERKLSIRIKEGDVYGVKVISTDVAVYPNGKTVSQQSETVHSNPQAARSDMMRREDWAEKQAVGGGIATLVEGFAGGAYLISGLKHGEITQILAGLGLLGGSWKTAKFTLNADRRRSVAGEIRRRLTRKFELSDGPDVKV